MFGFTLVFVLLAWRYTYAIRAAAPLTSVSSSDGSYRYSINTRGVSTKVARSWSQREASVTFH
jgi:hypothetical protein